MAEPLTYAYARLSGRPPFRIIMARRCEPTHRALAAPPGMQLPPAMRGLTPVAVPEDVPLDAIAETHCVRPTPRGRFVRGAKHEVVERPVLAASLDRTSIAADDADTAVLSGLPDPCTVLIDGAEHVVTGGRLELTSPMPATYDITIDHWPYRRWTATVTAG